MGKGLLIFLGLWLWQDAMAHSQERLKPIPADPVLPAQYEGAPASAWGFGDGTTVGSAWWGGGEAATDCTFWLEADYLLWWIQRGPLAAPLATIGSPTDRIPGALGQPGTQIAFGSNGLAYPNPSSGLRIRAGAWLDEERLIGFDVGYFVLEQQSVQYALSSNGAGSPLIARPTVFAPNGSEGSYADSFPGLYSGGIGISATTRLQGWEANLDLNAYHDGGLRVVVLAGFRSLDLNESLLIGDHLASLTTPGVLTFQGIPVNPPASLTDVDRFHVANTFYGGQIGSRVNWTTGALTASATAKLSLGDSQQLITIDGSTTRINADGTANTAPGGVLAQTSNIGRHQHDHFAVIPEVGLDIGYQLTPWLSAHAGYTFLYWSDVARPGDQIDRFVSPVLPPSDQNFNNGPAQAKPAALYRSTDFWAQGINFGLEFRF